LFTVVEIFDGLGGFEGGVGVPDLACFFDGFFLGTFNGGVGEENRFRCAGFDRDTSDGDPFC
jgi:hypothetical protein